MPQAQFSSELNSCFTFKCLSWYRKGIVSDISNLTRNKRLYLILGHLKFGTNYKVLKYKFRTFRFILLQRLKNLLTVRKHQQIYLGAPLTHDNRTRLGLLVAINLDSKPLRLRISPVFRASSSFLVRHSNSQRSHLWAQREGDRGDMCVQSAAEERSGERKGLEGNREAGERECRHEWCKEERV